MPREDKRTKGLRLLVDGRLFIREVNPVTGYIYAECRGDSGELYELGWNPWKKKWGCTCQARTDCSHLSALWNVVTITRGELAAPSVTAASRNLEPTSPPVTLPDSRLSAREFG